MYREYKLIKERNEKKLDMLEHEMAKLDKKEKNKQLWIEEQLENIDKRMEYVKLKNKRV
jgi:hypothetical protein